MQLQWRGTLTHDDTHQYLRHVFTVPPGATHIEIDFDYAPMRAEPYRNYLTLSIFDPFRARGTGNRHQARQHVTLSAAEAAPGYDAGPLPPGEWTAILNVHMVNPGVPVSYELDITIGFEESANIPAVQWSPGLTSPRGAGWYRGDLHAHTIHSDGRWKVPELVNFARQQGLDFVSLTDHNAVSGLPELLSLSSDDLLTMGGFELTTFHGHALALGVRHVVEWRVAPGQRTMTDIAQEIEAAGGLFIVAHPTSPGDPACLGCRWEYADLMPGIATHVEIWNSPWDDNGNNDAALALWYEWLNQGHRVVATAGTDHHGSPQPDLGYNVVYADALTERAILEGIRRGHLYLSSGPTIRFTGKLESGMSALMGDTLSGDHAAFDVEWDSCQASDVVRLIVDGEVREEIVAVSAGAATWKVSGKHWCLIEIRDPKNNIRAVSNPIYIAPADGL